MFGHAFFAQREAESARSSFKKLLTEHPIIFGESKWVAPAAGIKIPDPVSSPLSFSQDGYYVLGEKEGITAIGLPGGQITALISDSPFLVVYVEAHKAKLRNEEIVYSESTGGFNPARQVKNGKLGRMPEISKRHPRYIRLKSSHWRWANLKDLCDIVGMEAKILMETYLAVADPRLIEALDKTEYVNLPEGMTEAEVDFSMVDRIRPFTRVRHVHPKLPKYHNPMFIDTNLFTYYKYQRVNFRSVLDCMERTFEYRQDPSRIFIPAGLAINILLLNQFGYQPRKL